jgi:hypothetical protein
MENRSRALASVLMDQWGRVWDMWEAMIRAIPDDEWRCGEVDYLIPARHLVHALACEDAFLEEVPLEQVDDFRLFEVREWRTPPETLVSREAALGKLAQVRTAVAGKLTELDVAALLKAERVHLWAGETRLGKLLYVLRHSQHHLGEVNAELCRRGYSAALWEKEKRARSEI